MIKLQLAIYLKKEVGTCWVRVDE
uniref:Uncharacterized protein n=1 Tax=Arundo donax TaxID=35708 RepID=A0A0A8YEJ1_ARUDO